MNIKGLYNIILSKYPVSHDLEQCSAHIKETLIRKSDKTSMNTKKFASNENGEEWDKTDSDPLSLLTFSRISFISSQRTEKQI